MLPRRSVYNKQSKMWYDVIQYATIMFYPPSAITFFFLIFGVKYFNFQI